MDRTEPGGTRERALIAAEVAVFVGIVVVDSWGWVPLTQTVALLPAVLAAQWLARRRLAQIGFARPPGWARALGVGIAAGLAMEAFALAVTTPLISAAFGVEPDHGSLKAIRGNASLLLVFLALSWTLAAFGEELCFRGFLTERLARAFGGGRYAWWAGTVLSSALFGWGHTEQGVSGWLQEGLSGLWLGLLFLATGRNLVAPIVAHGVSNTLAFVLIYFGAYPGLG